MKKASVLFTTALVLSTIVLAPVAHAVDVDKQIEETETKLNEIKASQSAVEAELARIDSELAGLESEAAAVQADIAAARERLGVLNQEIAKLEENIVKRTEKIAEQARTIQLTGGEINYFSILTSSESFAEVVSKYNAANEFMTAGQHLRRNQQDLLAAVSALTPSTTAELHITRKSAPITIQVTPQQRPKPATAAGSKASDTQ